MFTSNIAFHLQSGVKELLGFTPHLIISRLERVKLDPNRPIDEATQNHPIAMEAYNEFHTCIRQCQDMVKARGPGLVLDIHGHQHEDQWTELGYNIKREDINNDVIDWRESSILGLSERVLRNGTPFQDLICGRESFGAFLQNEGFKVVPSPDYPRPNSGYPGQYYRGGHITRQHGSLEGGVVDCVQLELPLHVRDSHQVTGPKLARGVANFVKRYYLE